MEFASLLISPATAPPPLTEVAARYLGEGFRHILPLGPDHLLFVLGLFLRCRSVTPLVWQITLFTMAHSLTLGLTEQGWLRLPEVWVEVAIAVSIVFVAVENLSAGVPGWRRILLVVAAGLVHGMGFAHSFSGLGEGPVLAALFSFNVGVELGQLTVVAVACLLAAPFWRKPWYRERVVVPASLAIAGAGVFWVLERLGLFS